MVLLETILVQGICQDSNPGSTYRCSWPAFCTLAPNRIPRRVDILCPFSCRNLLGRTANQAPDRETDVGGC